MEITGLTRVENPHAKADVAFAFKYNRWVLIFTSAWPFSNPSIFRRLVVRIVILVQCLLLMIFKLGYAIGIAISTDSFDLKLKHMVIVALAAAYFIKYLTLLFQGVKIRACYQQLQADWQQVYIGTRNLMLDYANIGRRFTTMFIGVMVTVLLSWPIVALIKPPLIVENITIYTLPYPASFIIIDPRIYPFYPVMFIIQLLATWLLTATGTNTCTAVSFVVHLCGQYEILQSIVKNIGQQGVTKEKLDTTFRNVVRKHYEIMRFSTYIESAFKWCFFIEWFTCISGVCICSYFILTESEGFAGYVRSVINLVGLNFSFLLACYIGEQLMIKCISFGEAAYLSCWYNLPQKQCGNLQMIQRFQMFPKKLSGGKIISLSMMQYAEVLKKSMAFLSLLRSITV